MTEYEEQFARFEQDIKSHALTVLRDEGLYRHLRCSAGSYVYQFDVITWPGYLCYAGDMGCFVFSRIPDMFAFFRGRRKACIDRSYLAEKAVASDKHDGIRTYSEDLFQRAVKSDFDAFVEAEALGDEQASELWQIIEDDVLSCGDTMHSAIDAAVRFRWSPNHIADSRGREVFPDFWEHRLKEFTSRFWWCCYAIPWAIEQYDARERSAQPLDEVFAVDPQASDPGKPTPREDGSSLSSRSSPLRGEARPPAPEQEDQ